MGGHFARIGADILLQIEMGIWVDCFTLPPRILNYFQDNDWPQVELVSNTDANGAEHVSNLFIYQLRDPQALRFYVRQTPNPSSAVKMEAVGIYFHPQKSLPPNLRVDDKSVEWDMVVLYSTRESDHYIIDFLDPLIPSLQPNTHPCATTLCGILQLSEKLSGESFILSVGLQHTSTNFLDTQLLYSRPWSMIYTPRSTASPDQICREFYSPTTRNQDSQLLRLTGGSKYQHGVYTTSFELHVWYGRVWYLMKVEKNRNITEGY